MTETTLPKLLALINAADDRQSMLTNETAKLQNELLQIEEHEKTSLKEYEKDKIDIKTLTSALKPLKDMIYSAKAKEIFERRVFLELQTKSKTLLCEIHTIEDVIRKKRENFLQESDRLRLLIEQQNNNLKCNNKQDKVFSNHNCTIAPKLEKFDDEKRKLQIELKEIQNILSTLINSKKQSSQKEQKFTSRMQNFSSEITENTCIFLS